MDLIDHWYDTEFDPETLRLGAILSWIGSVYFAYLYWRLYRAKRRRNAEANRTAPADADRTTSG